jgi:hypothetical protein
MKIKILLIAVIFALLAGNCYANPIVIGVPHMGKLSLGTSLGLMINFIADFIALCLGYLLIKKIGTLVCWKFLLYIGMVFLGGIIIDVLAIIPFQVLFFLMPIEKLSMLILFLLAGLLLYLFNSWLSEKLFNLEIKEKIVIGIVMALLTNPVIGLFFTD